MRSTASLLVAGLSVSPSAAAFGKRNALDGVAWGVGSSDLLEEAGPAPPDVVELASEEGRESFAIEAPTWARLLVLLCWFGETRIQGE